jgi:hypothetical protein
MGVDLIDEEIIRSTLGILLKYQSDIEKISPKISSYIPE